MDVIRTDFSQAAADYDKYAFIQKQTADELLTRLDFFNLQPRRVLDLGAGAGYLSAKLQQKYPAAQIVGVDFAPGMCEVATVNHPDITFVCADIADLPFPANFFDLVISNFTLQWCDEPTAVFAGIKRVTAPLSVFMFSTVGAGSLLEMRHSWALVDDNKRVRDFLDMHDLGDMLYQAGWQEPVIDVGRLQRFYASVNDILQEFKLLGVTNKERDRLRGLTGKAKFTAFGQAYEAWRVSEGLPLSWEIVYGYARTGKGLIY